MISSAGASASLEDRGSARAGAPRRPRWPHQQGLARPEVVDQHAVAGAQRGGQAPQPELADAVLGHVRHRSLEQPLAGARRLGAARARRGSRPVHGRSVAVACTSRYMYHAVHHGPASESNTPPQPPLPRPPSTRLLREGATWPCPGPRSTRSSSSARARARPRASGPSASSARARSRAANTVAELVEDRRFSYTHESKLPGL